MRDNSPYINIHTHKPCANELTITSLGIHPYDAEGCCCLSEESVEVGVDAIGEIGLDFARPIDRAKQERLFTEQLSLAERLELPVVLHSVRAVDRTLQILKSYRLRAVIFHGFIGSEQQARVAFQRGYLLSFGERTFASPKTLAVLRMAPLDSIFFETDESELPIETIYCRAAEYRSETLGEIKDKLYKNYIKIFKKQ